MPSISSRPLVVLALLLLLGASRPVAAQDGSPAAGDLALLPPGVEYDPAVPRPEEVLGWPVGTWHVRPDQIARYFEILDETSPRVSLSTTGHTWEQRPLLLAAVTSPTHHARLSSTQKARVEALRRGERAPGPAVAWLGYSVHGNESSGANAALLVAYHLAAAQGEEVERLLRHVIVLLDPCLNPDGLARFAQWANMHKGRMLVSDNSHREHAEGWPSGRGNHYWADLNRDWLLLTHPESRARVAAFQDWRPNVLTDHHEMGTNTTFFFQPGVPDRTNPLTPPRNQELTGAIAAHHARALDELGELYYTRESFDDFYYGKGSTYPDIHGAVGILFEQASSRGHLAENDWGRLAFADTIRNQVAVSFSTLRATLELSDELLDFQAEAARAALAGDESDPRGGWILGDDGDPVRAARMLDILLAQRIEVRELSRAVEREGATYTPGAAWIVPSRQPQGLVARALLERVTTFPDTTFYDVSTWTLPLAFGVPCHELTRAETLDLAGPSVPASPAPGAARVVDPARPVRAWLVDWTSAAAPRALSRLLAAGVRVGVATRPLTADTHAGPRAFPPGTLVVSRGVQDVSERTLDALLDDAAATGVGVHAVSTGLALDGIDLGSPSLRPLVAPRPVLVVGSGVSSYEAGEMWMHLDQTWDIPVVLLDVERLGTYDLDETTHVLFAGSSASKLDDGALERLDAWVRAGGVLVGTTRSTAWIGSRLLGETARDDDDDVVVVADEPDAAAVRPAYADAEAVRARDLVSGAFLAAELDLTHPLAFGIPRAELPVFRSGTHVLRPASDAYTNVALYADAPLLSGYASDANVRRLAGTAAVIAQRRGAGAVIRMADNPVFRGVTHGSARLLANALFFGHVLQSTAARDDDAHADH